MLTQFTWRWVEAITPTCLRSSSSQEPLYGLGNKAQNGPLVSSRHANRKSQAEIQTWGFGMRKPEMFHLSEMLDNACQINVPSWNAWENIQNRHSRGQQRCWIEFKSICNSSLLQWVCIKEERERKQQPQTIFCESVAEKDIDSVKGSKKFVSPSEVICWSLTPSMAVWGGGASKEVSCLNVVIRVGPL